MTELTFTRHLARVPAVLLIAAMATLGGCSTVTALNALAGRQETLALRSAALESGDGPNPPAPFPTGEGGANAAESPLPRRAGEGAAP